MTIILNDESAERNVFVINKLRMVHTGQESLKAGPSSDQPTWVDSSASCAIDKAHNRCPI